MAKPTRTFIALELNPKIQKSLTQLMERLKDVPAEVKWVEATQMHITLKFLGDVHWLKIEEICRKLQAQVKTMKAFAFDCAGTGAFPSREKPHTLWAGVTAGEEQLIELQEKFDVTLEQFGFRRENRRFVPHITLGRVRTMDGPNLELAARLQAEADTVFGTQLVTEAVFFSSHITRHGPEYDPLGRVTLRK